MVPDFMQLKLLIPTDTVIDQPVQKIVAEGEHGSFCLLPGHVDFLAILVPGLLSFVDESGGEYFTAADAGVLVKRDRSVLVSCRQATRGTDLNRLQEIIHQEFSTLTARERAARSATAKLEASFLRRYLEFVEESR